MSEVYTCLIAWPGAFDIGDKARLISIDADMDSFTVQRLKEKDWGGGYKVYKFYGVAFRDHFKTEKEMFNASFDNKLEDLLNE